MAITYHVVHDHPKDAKKCKHPEYDIRRSITLPKLTECQYCHQPVHYGIVKNKELMIIGFAEHGNIGGKSVMRTGNSEKKEMKHPKPHSTHNR